MNYSRNDDSIRPWCPPVDVCREDHHYTVLADLPGMSKEQIRVIASDNTLSISGERPFQCSEEACEHLRLERLHGKFVCEVHLPGSIRCDRLKTSYDDGVLSVTVPIG